MTTKRHVIVGGGVAAASAAATLRSRGFDGQVVVVSDEASLPYERPPLSKDFLRPESDGLPTLLRPADWYDEHDITLMLGTRATSVDPTAHRIELASGDTLDFDKLLLATGVRARRLPHTSSSRILTLRSLADASRVRKQLAAVDKVAVLGGGFIGCEAASTAVALGKRVTVLERTTTLMEAALGPVLGAVMTDVHRAAGVHVMGRCVVQSIEGTPSTLVVRTDRGTVEADLVLVGAGSQPNTELAESAGLDIDNGVLTDAHCRTNAPDVFAAGDVAAAFHPFYGAHLRVEHHDTAMHHGHSAAMNMLGHDEPFHEAHWFWSDQYGHTIQQVGRAHIDDQLVVRGSLDDLSFSAFSLRGDRITRVISLNRPKDVVATRRLLFAEHHASVELLQDESTPVSSLASRARPVGVQA
jgi:3-phenylpropionate/trans-cinnamate dioxygenase ferredoxin reductase subunit